MYDAERYAGLHAGRRHSRQPWFRASCEFIQDMDSVAQLIAFQRWDVSHEDENTLDTHGAAVGLV